MLDKSLSGVDSLDITNWLHEQGCEISDRQVRRWLADHADDLTAMRAERLRNMANSARFADRVNRVVVLGRVAERLERSLSSAEDRRDVAFLNGASLPMARELRDTLKQIQDECNDIEQPAKRVQLSGPDGGAIQHEDVTDWPALAAKATALLDGFQQQS